MKGGNRFRAEEIDQLKSYLRKKQSAPPGEQKRWKDKMRALEREAVEVVDQPSVGAAANKSAGPDEETEESGSGRQQQLQPSGFI